MTHKLSRFQILKMVEERLDTGREDLLTEFDRTMRRADRGVEILTDHRGLAEFNKKVKKDDGPKSLRSFQGFTGFTQGNMGYLSNGVALERSGASVVTQFKQRKNRENITPYLAGILDVTDIFDDDLNEGDSIPVRENILMDDPAINRLVNDSSEKYSLHRLMELLDMDVDSYQVGRDIEDCVMYSNVDLIDALVATAKTKPELRRNMDWITKAVQSVAFISTLTNYMLTWQYTIVMPFLRQVYQELNIINENLENALGIVVDYKVQNMGKLCKGLTRLELYKVTDIIGDVTTNSGNGVIVDKFRELLEYFMGEVLSDNTSVTVTDLMDYIVGLCGSPSVLSPVISDFMILPIEVVELIPEDSRQEFTDNLRDIIEDLPIKIEPLFSYASDYGLIDDELLDMYKINEVSEELMNTKYPMTKKMIGEIKKRYRQYRKVFN
ncbi:MAG: hypothetical protein ACRC7S_16735 [Cetobacterium sp.]